MKTFVDCIACKVRQATDVVKRCTDDPLLQEKALKEMLSLITELPFDRPPVAIRRDVEEVVKSVLGVNDAYLEHKRISNQIGALLYPYVKEIVEKSDNRLKTAIKLAVTGNIIDFGMFTIDEINEQKVRDTIAQGLEQLPEIDHTENLIERINESENIWYIADNCGELYFDRVLIEELPKGKVTVIVRGGPILNDATIKDAEKTGITKIAKVLPDGYNAPALILDKCDPQIREGFFDADLVICKGQGNYESLSEAGRRIFFLLTVKCNVVARDIGCKLGEIMILRSGFARNDK